MNTLKSLKDKILGARIDGVNFTGVSPVYSIADDNERIHIKINSFKNHFLEVFKLNESHVKGTSKGLTISETDSIGIYCEFKRRNDDLLILIQFKGLFFTKRSAYNHMKLLMCSYITKTNTFFSLTLIDIAKDILLNISEILPFEENILNNYFYKYSFNHKIAIFNEQRSNKKINTGFKIQNSRFAIKVYDKRYENSQHKNKLKKNYYEEYFSKFINEKKELLPVTRVELTLRQESCKRFTNSILNLNVSENLLIDNMLASFAKKHSLRQKPIYSKDKNFKRWPVVENWSDLFSNNSQIKIKQITTSDYLYTNPQVNIEKIAEKLVEALAFHNDIDLQLLTANDILRVLKPKISDIIYLAMEKRLKHRITESDFRENIKVIEKQISIGQVKLAVGDFV